MYIKCLKIHQLCITKLTKQDYKKNIMKTIVFLNKKKLRNENMVANDIKLSQKIKRKDKLSIEKDVMLCTRLVHKL